MPFKNSKLPVFCAQIKIRFDCANKIKKRNYAQQQKVEVLEDLLMRCHVTFRL